MNYLYKITNLVNNKIYIGVHKTNNIDDGYMGSGKIISFAIKKYGLENFRKDILEFFDTYNDALEKEKEIVTDEFLLREDVYNLKRGGNGGFDYINCAELNNSANNGYNGGITTRDRRRDDPEKDKEFRVRSSNRMKKLHSQGLIEYDTFSGKTHTDDAKLKISVANKGKNLSIDNSQFGTRWITNGVDNKKIKNIDTVPEGWWAGRIMRY